ncbi:MAG: peptidase S41 [Dehalococcoidia bacterium]|nr:peptidase S41 [Dehalococcoidia bacterium]MQG09555.1 S41 family peptidase [SAR202 cluster bacterium]|tara:strand:- start:5628 stop:6839 length:1212 start_codon:yes stop_codon:yes gene_type:complete
MKKILLILLTSIFVISCFDSSDKSKTIEITNKSNEYNDEKISDELKIIWEAYEILAEEYIDKENLNPENLAEEAIKGMLNSLNDPYTSYVPPETFKIDQESFMGHFGGIGANVEDSPDNNGILITKPMPNTPAENSGIKSGDRIIRINGEDSTKMTLLEAVNKIRGEKGTPVTLTIKRIGVETELDITIIRDIIDTPSVDSYEVPDTDFVRIVISQFTAKTHDEIIKIIDKHTDENIKGFILDLRGNPGGLLSSTVNVASLFIDEGLITYEITSDGNREEWNVRKTKDYKNLPIVTLVDRYSASGSEVLAGALQDHKRSIIIGEKTFGKGSVNMMSSLSNEGGIYVTIGRWYTPNGRLIEKLGIEPDLIIENKLLSELNAYDKDFVDLQLNAAITQLNFEIRN